MESGRRKERIGKADKDGCAKVVRLLRSVKMNMPATKMNECFS